MALNVRTGRALLARPNLDKGEEMADKAKVKLPEKPYRLKDRVRVCGKWQKKGYQADDEEKAAWAERCKNRGQDPKTGKPKVDKTAPAKK